MPASAETLAAFRAAIGDIPSYQDEKLLQAKSRDYYWYSPILKADLDRHSGQILVQPKSEAEVITIAAACARMRLPLTLRGGGTCGDLHPVIVDIGSGPVFADMREALIRPHVRGAAGRYGR